LQLLRAWLGWCITLKNYAMREIKQRIFDNWKTTALGLGILAVGFGFIWFEKITMSEFTAFVSGGLALLIAKDGK
jgi:hypothetical protein